MRAKVHALLVLSLALLGAACASAPALAPSGAARQLALTVTSDRIEPDARVCLEVFGAVAWLNARADRKPLEIRLGDPDGQLEAALTCRTTLGFARTAGGELGARIGAGDFASICFHRAGLYRYRITSGGESLSGQIEVRPGGRAQ